MSVPTDSVPEISVAVVNFNGEQTLEPTLRSILALEGVAVKRIMLVDNASTDASEPRVRRGFPQVQILSLPDNRGPNPARNKALHSAPSDLVLIMDNDIVLAPDYAARLAEVLRRDPQASAASGQIRLHDKPDAIQYNGISLHYAGEIAARSPDARGTVQVSCVSAGAVLMDRRKALDVGGFDEDFIFGWEDGDLTFRLSMAGYPCYMVSQAIAYHIRQKRGMKWVRYQTRNRWWFILKNYDWQTLVLAFPAIAFFQGCAGLFLLMKGEFPAFCGGTFDVLRRLPEIWRKRRQVQPLKILTDIELLQGNRLDLPGGIGTTAAGRFLNSIINGLFRVYWLLIRWLLRHSRRNRPSSRPGIHY